MFEIYIQISVFLLYHIFGIITNILLSFWMISSNYSITEQSLHIKIFDKKGRRNIWKMKEIIQAEVEFEDNVFHQYFNKILDF